MKLYKTMINMKRIGIIQKHDIYIKKENFMKQWYIWKEREFHKAMINMIRNRISFMLTSAPCSTKNRTISIDSYSIATLRGQWLISREFHKAMINMKRKRRFLINETRVGNFNDIF